MKKKLIVIALAVAMLALPLSAVSAKKPETMILTGTKTLTGNVDIKPIFAGTSYIELAKNGGGEWIGDIEGFGLYSGLALYKANGGFMWVGRWVFEEATIDGLTGGLRIGTLTKGNYITGEVKEKMWVESGTGELSSIRGEGNEFPLNEEFTLWAYTFEIQINP